MCTCVRRALNFLSAAAAFYRSLMRFSHRTTALPNAQLFKVKIVGLSTCMHLINVSLMVLHLASRHLLQHSSQRHPLSFQMFTCPSKQTQPFGSFSCVPLDGKGLRRRQEKGREGGVFKSAALLLSGMENLVPVISKAIVCHVSVELIASFFLWTHECICCSTIAPKPHNPSHEGNCYCVCTEDSLSWTKYSGSFPLCFQCRHPSSDLILVLILSFRVEWLSGVGSTKSIFLVLVTFWKQKLSKPNSGWPLRVSSRVPTLYPATAFSGKDLVWDISSVTLCIVDVYLSTSPVQQTLSEHASLFSCHHLSSFFPLGKLRKVRDR